MEKLKVGIIGCGVISDIYLQNLTRKYNKVLEVIAVSDLDIEKAKDKQDKYSVEIACCPEALLENKDIDIVLNLTTPRAHKDVCIAALNSGKHVYVEKPLAITLEDGLEIITLGENKNLRIGCAPDTFLGGALQTCKKIIEDGLIGKPIAATAFVTSHGHESWHENPEFFYKEGGGPMLDIGPYYLTALVNLMGPVVRVSGSSKVTFPQRTITSPLKYGQIIDVDVATHVAGLLDFENGAIATIITSFDVWSTNLPIIEIYGTEGTLSVPDPNLFDGEIRIKRAKDNEFSHIPIEFDFTDNSRGLGLVDMALAIDEKREHQVNGNLAYHVLEIMEGIELSSQTSNHINIESRCKKTNATNLGDFI